MTLLTVVTVVRNDASGLHETLASIDRQRTPPDEIVVIDGSDDRAVVPGVAAQFPALRPTVSWHEPRGVYPAMNEGLAAAGGRYVYFLNAGDSLAGDMVLGDAAHALADRSPDWAYGTVRFVAEDGSPTPSPDWEYREERRRLFARGRFPAHQGVIASRDALRAVGAFDTSYRVAADYAAICRLSRMSVPLELGFTLAEFRVGGLSTTDWRRALGEFHRARIEAFQPTGAARVLERWDTGRVRLSTTAYRTLWAPGRPLHGVAGRLRGNR